jgi:hypothetical protein
MDYQKVVVRPKISSTDEDPVGKALGAHGMSKFAGCPDTFMGAVYDRTLGRYLTNLDENHPDVLNLPQDEREIKQKEILEERAFLEKELGKDLHHTNVDFWSTLEIRLDRGKLYNTRIPMDRIIVGVLKAGKMVPTSKDDIGNPDYIGVHFYIGNEFEDVTERVVKGKKERRVAIKLEEVIEDFDYAVELSQYLNIQGISSKMPRNNLDDVLSVWLEKKPANKEAFLDAVDTDKAFIRLYNQFLNFKTARLVKFEDGKWRAGKIALGSTEKTSVKKLLSADPVMQAELSRLLEDYKDLGEPKN